MTDYYLYKVFIGDVYFVTVSKDSYPSRVMCSIKRNSEYLSKFGNELASIAFLKKINENSLALAKQTRDLYAITQMDIIKANKTPAYNSVVPGTGKYCDDDLFYCEDCGIFCGPTSKLRHLSSVGHKKVVEETLIVD